MPTNRRGRPPKTTTTPAPDTTAPVAPLPDDFIPPFVVPPDASDVRVTPTMAAPPVVVAADAPNGARACPHTVGRVYNIRGKLERRCEDCGRQVPL